MKKKILKITLITIIFLLIIGVFAVFAIRKMIITKRTTYESSRIETDVDIQPDITIRENYSTQVFDVGSPPYYEINFSSKKIKQVIHKYNQVDGATDKIYLYEVTDEKITNIQQLAEQMMTDKESGKGTYSYEEAIAYSKEHSSGSFPTYYSIKYMGTTYYTAYEKDVKIIEKNIR